MEDKKSVLKIEEVNEAEINDVWDIFFPYRGEKCEVLHSVEVKEQKKPRNHMHFLTM